MMQPQLLNHHTVKHLVEAARLPRSIRRKPRQRRHGLLMETVPDQ
jgi:hypothetical protein